MPTNTLILSYGDGLVDIDDIAVHMQFIQQWLHDNVLTKFDINSGNPIELVSLKKLKKILIITPNHELAELIKSDIQRAGDYKKYNFRIGYSMQDSLTNEKVYLEVPKSQKMFLISPPVSPPSEFDYSRVEEEPSKNTQHDGHHTKSDNSLNDVYNSNPKLGDNTNIAGRTTLMVNGTGVNQDPKLLLNSKVGKIRLERRGSNLFNDDGQFISVEKFATALPPRSTFDDDSDLEE